MGLLIVEGSALQCTDICGIHCYQVSREKSGGTIQHSLVHLKLDVQDGREMVRSKVDRMSLTDSMRLLVWKALVLHLFGLGGQVKACKRILSLMKPEKGASFWDNRLIVWKPDLWLWLLEARCTSTM